MSRRQNYVEKVNEANEGFPRARGKKEQAVSFRGNEKVSELERKE